MRYVVHIVSEQLDEQFLCVRCGWRPFTTNYNGLLLEISKKYIESLKQKEIGNTP